MANEEKIQRRELQVLKDADRDYLYQKDLHLSLSGKAQKSEMSNGE